MSWSTNYSGPQLDQNLEKGRNLKVVDNGWIILESSEDAPLSLNNLTNPGNYTIYHWTNGPTLEELMSPLNISVIIINGTLFQFVNALGYTYHRVVNSDNTASEWAIDQTYGVLKPGPSVPSSVEEGKTMWLDTTDAVSPILKLYICGEWKEIIPASVMQDVVYDPQGKKRDIFKYIESSISKILDESGSVDFTDHTSVTDIHTTIAEKTKWDNAPTKDMLNDRNAEIKSNIDTKVSDEFGSDTSKFGELSRTLTETNNKYNQHIGNTTIHPDSTKRSRWDGKATSTHTHHQDGNVTIDPAHVSGVIPINKLGDDVKEKTYIVNSINEMYTYTKSSIHNGDIFCVENAAGTTWYVVIDDSQLGTANAFKLMSKPIDATWLNIANTPTTVSSYGITNAAKQQDVTNINNHANSIRGNLSVEDEANIIKIMDAEAARNEVYSIIKHGNPYTLLDNIVAKLNSVTE